MHFTVRKRSIFKKASVALTNKLVNNYHWKCIVEQISLRHFKCILPIVIIVNAFEIRLCYVKEHFQPNDDIVNIIRVGFCYDLQ